MKYHQSFCFKYFGKRCKELTEEEKKEFNRLQKSISRKNNPKQDKIYYENNKEKCLALCKKWKEENKDKVKELRDKYSIIRKTKIYEERGYGPYEGTKSFKYFGKRFKDLTRKELNLKQRLYYLKKKEENK